MWQTSNLLIAVLLALLTVALFYFTPPGRRLRYRMVRKRVERLSAERKAEVLLRVAGARWRFGLAILSPGRLDFASYVGGVQFLKRRPVSFQVVAISAAPSRPLRGREKFWGDPNIRVVTLTTPAETLELAVPPPYGPDQVLARLAH